jgi:putative copper export protein
MDNLIRSMPLWVEFTTIAFCTGILFVFLWILPAAESPDRDLRDRLWLLFIVSATVAITASSIDLLLRVAEMSGDTVLSSFPELPTAIAKTHSGRVWLIRIACLVLTLAVGNMKKVRDTRPVLMALLCLVAIIALTESASGHAADKGDFTMAEIVDWIHLLGALVWAGGIFVLSFEILPRSSALDIRAFNTLARRAARFSRIVGIAVCSLALTSLYNAWVYVGSIKALVRTSYGLTVSTKIVLLSILLFLAAYNRYISVPILGKFAGLATAKTGFLSRFVKKVYSGFSLHKTEDDVLLSFKRVVRVEVFLLLGLLFCATLLRHEIPARHALHGGQAGGPLHEHMRH